MSDRTRKYILYSIGILFIGSIFWSIIAETLLPLLRAGDTRGFFLNLFGIPLTLLGTGAIVYGGYRFVVSTLSTFVSPEMQADIDIIQAKSSTDPVRAARRRNMQRLWQAWKLGLVWMIGGFLLIAAGGFIINY